MKNKKIIFYVTRQYMLKNKKRTFTTFLGIIFMVMLMTCVFVGKDTAFSYLEQTAALKSGDWHIRAYEADSRQYEQIKALDYVDETAVSMDMGFSDCAVSKNEEKPYWKIKGYSKECFDWMHIQLQDGRFPQNENEIIISQSVLEDGADIKIGDRIFTDCFQRFVKGIDKGAKETIFPFYNMTVKTGETVEVPQEFPVLREGASVKEIHKATGYNGTFTVVGIMKAPSYEGKAGAFYAALTFVPDTLEQNQTGNVTARFDFEKMPIDYAYMDDFTEIMGGNADAFEVNDLLLIFSANSSESNMNVIVNFMVGFFVILILIVSILLIYNVFNISFEERRKYLGMLSSVGATKGQKRSSIYYEAFLLLLFALPIGFVLGIGVVKIGMLSLRPYLLRMLDTLIVSEVAANSVNLNITLGNIVLVIIVATLTVMMSAYLPARKIGKIGPLESIKGNDATQIKHFKTNRRAFKKGKAELLLATNNLKLQRQKTKSIVRAIAVFLIILVVTMFGANAVTKMVHYRLVDDVSVKVNLDGYDYVLHEMPEHGESYNALKEEILEDSDIADTKEWSCAMFIGFVEPDVLSREYWDKYRLLANEYYPEPFTDEAFATFIKDYTTSVSIYAVDQKTYEDIAKKSGADMKFVQNDTIPSALFYQNIEMSTDNFRFETYKAKHYRFYELEHATDLSIGQQFKAAFYNSNTEKAENVTFTLAGYATNDSIKEYFTFHGGNAWIIISDSTAKKINKIMASGDSRTLSRELYIKLKNHDGALADKLKELSVENNDNYQVTVLGDSYGVTTIANTVNLIIDIVAVCFVVFASVICLLNLFNSIRGRAETRKREIAMLRSVGMEQKQINKMLWYENLCLFRKGVVWATLLSLPMLYGIRKVLQLYFGQVKLAVPWQMYVLAIIIAGSFIFGISKYCYGVKKDDNILEEIRKETV